MFAHVREVFGLSKIDGGCIPVPLGLELLETWIHCFVGNYYIIQTHIYILQVTDVLHQIYVAKGTRTFSD